MRNVDREFLCEFVTTLNNSDPEELSAAIKFAKHQVDSFKVRPSEKPIWKDLAALLRKDRKRY